MKNKYVKVEDKEFEIRSFGFFKANRILIGTLLPVIKDASTAISQLEGDGDIDMSGIISSIMSTLEEDKVIEIMTRLLENIYLKDVKIDADELEMDEGYELLQGVIELNYSSLGKLLGKLTEMLPQN